MVGYLSVGVLPEVHDASHLMIIDGISVQNPHKEHLITVMISQIGQNALKIASLWQSMNQNCCWVWKSIVWVA